MKKKRTHRRSTSGRSGRSGRSGTRDKRAKSHILRLMSETMVPSDTNRDALDRMSNDQLKESLRRCQDELESYTVAKISMKTLIKNQAKEIKGKDKLLRNKDKLLRNKDKGTGRQRRSRRVYDRDEDDRVRFSDDSVDSVDSVDSK